MKTKMAKKKMAKAKTEQKADEMCPQSLEDSDVDEDRPVADLSEIPTPKIEFVMPNLKPVKIVPDRKAKTAVLSAEVLNNEIVRMRSTVDTTKRFLSMHLKRKIVQLQKKIDEKPNDMHKRKIQRWSEELSALKDINRDEISKFGLLNKKSFNELNITESTTASERSLYKLVTHKNFMKAVTKFRKTYPEWEASVAFLLQRLGLQYAGKRDNVLRGKSDTKNPAETSSAKTTEDKATKNKAEKKSNATLAEKQRAAKNEIEPEDQRSNDELSCSETSGVDEGDVNDDEAIDLPNSDQEVDDPPSDDEEDDDRGIEDVEMGTDTDEESEESTARRRKILTQVVLLGGGWTSLAAGPIGRIRPDHGLVKKEADPLANNQLLGLIGLEEDDSRKLSARKQKNDSSGNAKETQKLPVSTEAVKTKKVARKITGKDTIPENTTSDAVSTNVVKNVLQKTLLEQTKQQKKKQKKVKKTLFNPTQLKPIEAITMGSNKDSIVQKVKLSSGGVVKLEEKRKSVKDSETSKETNEKVEQLHSMGSFFMSANAIKRPWTMKIAVPEDTGSSEEPNTVKSPQHFGQEKTDKLQCLDQAKKPPAKLQGHNRMNTNKGSKRGGEKTEDELHPSWIARKKLKEQQSVRPQGKKIIFDD